MGAATGEGVINIQLYDSIYMQRGVEISVVDSSTTCKDWIVDSTEVLIKLLVKPYLMFFATAVIFIYDK